MSCGHRRRHLSFTLYGHLKTQVLSGIAVQFCMDCGAHRQLLRGAPRKPKTAQVSRWVRPLRGKREWDWKFRSLRTPEEWRIYEMLVKGVK